MGSRGQQIENSDSFDDLNLDSGTLYILIGTIGIIGIVVVLKFGKIKGMIKNKNKQ